MKFNKILSIASILLLSGVAFGQDYRAADMAECKSMGIKNPLDLQQCITLRAQERLANSQQNSNAGDEQQNEQQRRKKQAECLSGPSPTGSFSQDLIRCSGDNPQPYKAPPVTRCNPNHMGGFECQTE